MVKKSRSPLTMADGTVVRNLEQLREHFDLESVIEAYMSGKLLTWLQNRNCDSEAELVENLDNTAADLQQKLCKILGVEYTGESADLDEIADRQERLARLRTFTDDAECIAHVDQVAFDQEELADLLDDEETTIYLCGEKFTVPASRKGITYIGVNAPSVHISGKLPKAVNALGIEFTNCNVDNLPTENREFPSVASAQEQSGAAPCAYSVPGELIDEIAMEFFNPIQETANYILYEREGYREEEDLDGSFELQHFKILYNKLTGEKKRLPLNFPRVQKGCVDGDCVYYLGDDENKIRGDKGAIWTYDASSLTVPKKLFSTNLSGGIKDACHNHVVYYDCDIGLAVYNMESRMTSKIPIGDSYCRAVYAVADGVYYALENYPDYSMNYYDYKSKKSHVVFKAVECIHRIHHIEGDTLFYIQLGEQCVKVDLSANGKNEKVEAAVVYDAFGTAYDGRNIYGYCDCLIYITREGIITSVDYKTGETREIADDAVEHHYSEGGLFRKASHWDSPVSLNRIGNWIIYNLAGKHAKRCRVSLDHPGEIEFMKDRYDLYENDELHKFQNATYDIPEFEIE